MARARTLVARSVSRLTTSLPLTSDAVVAPRRRIRDRESASTMVLSQEGTFGPVRARTSVVRKLTHVAAFARRGHPPLHARAKVPRDDRQPVDRRGLRVLALDIVGVKLTWRRTMSSAVRPKIREPCCRPPRPDSFEGSAPSPSRSWGRSIRRQRDGPDVVVASAGMDSHRPPTDLTTGIQQLIGVPVCIGPPSTVALRIGRETYETAALPLSYVGPGFTLSYS